MDPVGSAIIDFTEAAYDLDASDDEWLLAMLRRGMPALDQGLGVAGIKYGRPPNGGPVQVLRIHVASAQKIFPIGTWRQSLPPHRKRCGSRRDPGRRPRCPKTPG